MYNHYKSIGIVDGVLINETWKDAPGVVIDMTGFFDALAVGRHFDRPFAIG